jgi:hypothetical protein
MAFWTAWKAISGDEHSLTISEQYSNYIESQVDFFVPREIVTT